MIALHTLQCIDGGVVARTCILSTWEAELWGCHDFQTS